MKSWLRLLESAIRIKPVVEASTTYLKDQFHKAIEKNGFLLVKLLQPGVLRGCSSIGGALG